jgi:hypothetical protein
MDEEPVVSLLWHKRTFMVERREATSGRHLSMSLRVDEVTVLAGVGVTQANATESCADLELGAHVAGMRSVSARATAPRADASGLSQAVLLGCVDDRA